MNGLIREVVVGSMSGKEVEVVNVLLEDKRMEEYVRIWKELGFWEYRGYMVNGRDVIEFSEDENCGLVMLRHEGMFEEYESGEVREIMEEMKGWDDERIEVSKRLFGESWKKGRSEMKENEIMWNREMEREERLLDRMSEEERLSGRKVA